jgi:hypothetical protein
MFTPPSVHSAFDCAVWSALRGESEPAKSYAPLRKLVTPPPEPCDLS